MTARSLRNFSSVLLLISFVGCGRTSDANSSPAERPAAAQVVKPTPEPSPPPRSVVEQPANSPPEQTYRPDDDRQRHDDANLERAGIRKYVSRRLVLYTDIDEEKAVRLPPLVDALYDELVAYFGELPPARDGSEWQITGYVMRHPERFAAAELIPTSLPTFNHGLNRRRRFWMHEQSLDYYLEHLLLHEAVHCYMTTLLVPSAPAWYMEGMAEYFATHRTLPDGKIAFGIIPKTPAETQGFDRVTLIREEVDAGRTLSLDGVLALDESVFAEPLPYAWSWAACVFLAAQPDCRDRFRELGDVGVRSRFRESFDERFASDADALQVRWQHFVRTLCYGYNATRAVLAIDSKGTAPQQSAHLKVRPDTGWQSMRLRLKQGATYELSAAGQVSLADSLPLWSSDANGVGIDYAEGQPLGRLLAAIVGEHLNQPAATKTLFDPIDIGRQARLTAPINGILYLRINDRWDGLADNSGELKVHVREVED